MASLVDGTGAHNADSLVHLVCSYPCAFPRVLQMVDGLASEHTYEMRFLS